MPQKRRAPKSASKVQSTGSPATAATSGAVAREDELRALQKELNHANCQVAQLRDEVANLRRRADDGENARSTVAELSRELQNRTMRMEQQLAVARQFQRLFMPPELYQHPQARFAARYEPCARVGGDLYDVFDMGNGCVGILIADASGFGLTATLVSAVAKMAFDAFRQNEYSPRVIMDKVNQQILHNTLENQFLTAFLAVLDLETLRMKYVNSAHPCPIIFGQDRFELLDTEGLCCGMFDDPKYEEGEVQLKPGDRILLYTRGLVEACNGIGQAYENRRLYALLKAGAEQPIGEVVEEVVADFRRHLDDAEQIEDVTLIGVELVPREVGLERIVIPSEPMQLNRVETLILSRLEQLNYGERAVFGVRLAIEEAIINAIKHGNRMDKARKVIITWSADEQECVIHVEDEGPGFDPNAVPDPTADENLELPHGRGLVLIRAYMDDVSFNERGNIITLRKKAPWRE